MASKAIPRSDFPTKTQGDLLKRLKDGPVPSDGVAKNTETAIVKRRWATLENGVLTITKRGRDALLLVD